MKTIQKTTALFLLCALLSGAMPGIPARAAGAAEDSPETQEQEKRDYIKWMNFDIPYEALKKAMNLDVRSYESEHPIHWIELLAYLATQYWGNWKKYRAADMDKAAARLTKGESMASMTSDSKYYGYYYEIYSAVLSEFIGPYEVETETEGGGLAYEKRYGMKVFSPVAKGYWYSHYDDFGNTRTFGYTRKHLGNDLMGSVGTPVIAVESGVVEALGWNRYGGWRIGIRSFDKKRYYYYAHLRKNWPYVKTLKEGDTVKAGDVIGYLGRSGYSDTENINNIKTSHLHFGMQIIFDESQKEGNNEIWIDVYDIVNLLAYNKSAVAKDPETKEYHRACDFIDLRYADQFQ